MNFKLLVAVFIVILILLNLVKGKKGSIMVGGRSSSSVREGWHCIPGSSIPIKWINKKLACLSKDGKNCVYNVCRKGKFNPMFKKLPKRHTTCKPTPPWCRHVHSLIKKQKFKKMKPMKF